MATWRRGSSGETESVVVAEWTDRTGADVQHTKTADFSMEDAFSSTGSGPTEPAKIQLIRTSAILAPTKIPGLFAQRKKPEESLGNALAPQDGNQRAAGHGTRQIRG
jgi:hypothetical protein